TGLGAECLAGAGVKRVRDCRSPPGVVGCASGLAEAGGSRGRGALAGPALVAQRASGPPAAFTEYDDEEAEAAAVAARARQWMDAGVPPRQMAVLVRVNAQTERFERAFAEAGVPCRGRGAERFFHPAEVRQAA